MPRSALGQPDPLARGGQARIYRLPGYSLPGEGSLVYKEYLPRVRQKAGPALLPGLLAITEVRAGLPPDRRTQLDQRVIWPLRVVTGDDGGAAGILMREIPGEFFFTCFGDRKPLEFQQLFSADDDARRLGLSPADTHTRMRLLARLAAAYGMLHRLGIIVGDVSPKNVLYTTDVQPRVLVVDTDSARKQGTRAAFGSQPHTPAWEPPESLAAERRLKQLRQTGSASVSELGQLNDTWQRQTVETDVYKFGLMIVRVLDHGRQRSRNRDPVRARRLLGAKLGADAARLLDRTLSDDPKARPPMRDWYEAFGGRPAMSRAPSATAAARRPASEAGGTGAGQATSQAAPAPGTTMRPVSGWRFVAGTGWVRQ